MHQDHPASFSNSTLNPTLREGCYLIRFMPVASLRGDGLLEHYDGTMRFDYQDGSVTFSGDLYVHLPPTGEEAGEWPFIEPNPAQYGEYGKYGGGIPIFPISAYSYYLRGIGTDLTDTEGGSIQLRFEIFRFQSWSTDTRFVNQGCHTAKLQRTPAPLPFQSKVDYWAGSVTDCAGVVVGFLTIGWIAPYLREIFIEMDSVSGASFPLSNGHDITWQTIFDTVGWKVTVIEGQKDIAEPSGESWSNAELHAAMLDNRNAVNLDRQWYYYLLCVRRADDNERGVMFDVRGADSNKVPREGAAIASDWEIPDNPSWGTVRGMRFGSATPVYFRAAVHEIGHALSLMHNDVGTFFMRVTEDIVNTASHTDQQFPENISWEFMAEDARRLRHFPDQWIRPGGEPFYKSSATPNLPVDAEYARELVGATIPARGLSLQLEALLPTVPLGAPVRIHATLTNATNLPLLGPVDLTFRSESVRGRVIDPTEAVRTFHPLIVCEDTCHSVEYEPGGRVEQSYTLLRGREGALFPIPGKYRIELDAIWEERVRKRSVTAAVEVQVSPAEDLAQMNLATQIFQSPDTFLTFVLAGDHLPEGVTLIEAALSNPLLRPHYAMAQVRRFGKAFRDRPADLKAVADVLDDRAVLSPSEINRAATLIASAPNQGGENGNHALTVLRNKATKMTIGVEVLRHFREP